MFAVTFPGQGSQRPGMGQELVGQIQAAALIFDEISDAVGQDMRKLCFESNEDSLRQTQNAQMALFACGLAAWHALKSEADLSAAVFAGHSVGEYAAVVSAGALSVADGARLVQKRGQLMANAPRGTMAAILGLDREKLQDVCSQVEGVVVIANDNCPGQLVISGEVEAVGRASTAATEAGAKRALPLNVSGAFHSPLMEDAAQEMAQALAAATWQPQHTPVLANVTAQPVSDSSNWADLLAKQLRSSVRWTESVLAMRGMRVDVFVECGVGEVLTGLLKRIDKEAKGISVESVAGLTSARELLSGVTA